MATATTSNEKFEKLAGELESWSIMDIAEFGKYLQERWGVSAAPVAAAAAPAGGGAAAPAAAGSLQRARRLGRAQPGARDAQGRNAERRPGDAQPSAVPVPADGDLQRQRQHR